MKQIKPSRKLLLLSLGLISFFSIALFPTNSKSNSINQQDAVSEIMIDTNYYYQDVTEVNPDDHSGYIQGYLGFFISNETLDSLDGIIDDNHLQTLESFEIAYTVNIQGTGDYSATTYSLDHSTPIGIVDGNISTNPTDPVYWIVDSTNSATGALGYYIEIPLFTIMRYDTSTNPYVENEEYLMLSSQQYQMTVDITSITFNVGTPIKINLTLVSGDIYDYIYIADSINAESTKPISNNNIASITVDGVTLTLVENPNPWYAVMTIILFSVFLLVIVWLAMWFNRRSKNKKIKSDESTAPSTSKSTASKTTASKTTMSNQGKGTPKLAKNEPIKNEPLASSTIIESKILKSTTGEFKLFNTNETSSLNKEIKNPNPVLESSNENTNSKKDEISTILDSQEFNKLVPEVDFHIPTFEDIEEIEIKDKTISNDFIDEQPIGLNDQQKQSTLMNSVNESIELLNFEKNSLIPEIDGANKIDFDEIENNLFEFTNEQLIDLEKEQAK